MKKIICPVIALLIIAACLTGCLGKDKDEVPEVKGAEMVTNNLKEYLPVVTDENGDITRSDNGDLYLMATDENGDALKDDDGNYVTEKADLEYGVVINNRVEFNNFSVPVPDGWVHTATFTSCTLRKGSAEDDSDTINICYYDDMKISEFEKQIENLFNAIEGAYDNCERNRTQIVINNNACPLFSLWYPATDTNAETFTSYTYMTLGKGLITVSISGHRNMLEDMDEIVEILNSITYYK